MPDAWTDKTAEWWATCSTVTAMQDAANRIPIEGAVATSIAWTAEFKQRFPKSRVPSPPAIAPDASWEVAQALHAEWCGFAKNKLKRSNTELDAELQPWLAAYNDAHDACTPLADAEERLRLFVVLPRVVGADVVVATSGTWDYGTQTDPTSYAGQRAELYKAVWKVRGFNPWIDVVRSPSGTSFAIHADVGVPVEIAKRIGRSWRLDDLRLCELNRASNWKALFGNGYPYVGPWEFKGFGGSRDPETRDSSSFALQRANEEEHCRRNA